MAEIFENKMDTLKPEILAAAGEIERMIDGIDRCTQRLRRLIKLRSPMIIVANEIRMIQYRALGALSFYEAFALLDFATSDDPQVDECEEAPKNFHYDDPVVDEYESTPLAERLKSVLDESGGLGDCFCKSTDTGENLVQCEFCHLSDHIRDFIKFLEGYNNVGD